MGEVGTTGKEACQASHVSKGVDMERVPFGTLGSSQSLPTRLLGSESS